MKKFLVFLLVIAFAGSLFGCAANDPVTDTGASDTNTSTATDDPKSSASERDVEPITTLGNQKTTTSDCDVVSPEDIIRVEDTHYGYRRFSVFVGTIKSVEFDVSDPATGLSYKDPEVDTDNLLFRRLYTIEVKESVFGSLSGTIILDDYGYLPGEREEEQLKILNEANRICTGTLHYYPTARTNLGVGGTYLFTTVKYESYPYQLCTAPEQTCLALDSKEAKELIAYFKSEEAQKLIAEQAAKEAEKEASAQTE